jgi:hypothetical protein
MVSFRKSVIVMALLVIVTGIAVAQVTNPIVSCSTYNQQTARLRQEGVTELTPNLTFACTVYNQLANQGAPVTSGTLYDWEVLFPVNAPLTSSSYDDGSITEPTLTVDVVPTLLAGTPAATVRNWDHSAAASGVSEFASDPAGLPTFYATKGVVPGGIYNGNGTQNPGGGGSVIFAQVNMNPNGDTGLTGAGTSPVGTGFDTVYITISGLRVSALQLASNPPNYGGPLVLTVWAKPSQTKNGANQSNPGNVFLPLVNDIQQPTLAVTLGYAAPSLLVTETGFFDWRQCYDFTDGTPQYFQVDFAGLYSYAFAPPTDGWETNTVPSAGYGGTRLAFTISNNLLPGSPDPQDNFPAYVTVSVPSAIEVLNAGSVVVEALLVSNATPTGSGGTLADMSSLDAFVPDSNVLGGSAVTGTYYAGPWVNVDTTAGDQGSNLVVYEILPPTALANAVTTTLEVPVMGVLNAVPPSPYPPPDDGTAAVTLTFGGYAPWTPAQVPQLTPIPRFSGISELTTNQPLLEVDPCVTNLLYPYLVAGFNWDTGITVANTGLDPFGTNGMPALRGSYTGAGNDQPGVCYVYLYGSFDSNVASSTLGGPLVTDATNPPAPIIMGAAGFNGSATGDDPGHFIQPGTTSEDLILGVLELQYPKVDWNKHTWNGYAIAHCDFLYAHGYAFTVYHGGLETVTNGGNLSLGYLALVFNERGVGNSSENPRR